MSIDPPCTHPVDDFMPCRVCIPPTPPMTHAEFIAAVAELLNADVIDLTATTPDSALEERSTT